MRVLDNLVWCACTSAIPETRPARTTATYNANCSARCAPDRSALVSVRQQWRTSLFATLAGNTNNSPEEQRTAILSSFCAGESAPPTHKARRRQVENAVDDAERLFAFRVLKGDPCGDSAKEKARRLRRAFASCEKPVSVPRGTRRCANARRALASAAFALTCPIPRRYSSCRQYSPPPEPATASIRRQDKQRHAR